MMEAVLMSIKPKYCELIAKGKKTVEVRKTKPKLKTPFKCYIYCTKDKNNWFFPPIKKPTFRKANYYEDLRGNGKVIGEFVCDEIDTYDDDTIHAFSTEDYSKWNDFDLYNSCIHPEDLEHYANDDWLYGWHISNLVIYDKPKELSDFYNRCYSGCKKCEYQSVDSFFDDKELVCAVCNKKPLKKAPQSWCYVDDFIK